MSYLQECIDSGVNLLNRRMKSDWYNDINLEKLDIECMDNCIISQLLGSYNKFYDWDEPYPGSVYGFSACDEDYPTLNKLWKETIKKLKSEQTLQKQGLS